MINYYVIEIEGKNIKQFLKQIFKKNINIVYIKYFKNKVELKLSYEDYKKLKEIKTTYKISIIKISGKKKLFQDLKKYKVSILVFIISVFFLIFLSNNILFIEIDTNNNELKKITKNELIRNNITTFSIKKSYNELNNISKNIKNNNPNSIEWIELSTKGVYLKAKVIERVKSKEKNKSYPKDIVANKNSYIRKIYSNKGDIIKNINDYVKKGETIISGTIKRNDKEIKKVSANGIVYGEVWYITKISSSKKYESLKENEKGNLKLVLKIFNKEITIFKIKKEIKIPTKNIIFKNKNFSLQIKKEKTYSKTETIYTSKILQTILETKVKNIIEKDLSKDEYIINQKTLKKTEENGKLYIEVFSKVYENISKEKKISNKLKKEVEKKE